MSEVKLNKQQAAQVTAEAEVANLKHGALGDAVNADKAIAEAVKAVKGGRQAVQKAAVAILLHAYKTGDYRKANDLVKALGNGINGRALVQWFVDFGGLEVANQKSKQDKGFVAWAGTEWIAQWFEDAKATPWWTMAPQNIWGGYDLNKELNRVLNGYKSALTKVDTGLGSEQQIDLHVDSHVKAQLMALLQAL